MARIGEARVSSGSSHEQRMVRECSSEATVCDLGGVVKVALCAWATFSIIPKRSLGVLEV